MQRAKAMVERIKVDPLDNLHIINDVNMDFLIRSQTIHECWYALNLGIECCEYEDRVSICKHLLVVKKLVEVKFTYLKRMLHAKKDEFLINFDDVGEDDIASPL